MIPIPKGQRLFQESKILPRFSTREIPTIHSDGAMATF